MKKIIFLLLITSTIPLSQAQQLDAARLRKHVEYLASDELEGRGTATMGEIKAANYLAEQFRLAGLQPRGDKGTFFQPFGLTIPFEGVPHQVTARNVAGYLDNGAAKTIVIGAHYDHLGRGYQSGSLSPNSKNVIHNGADDNASGAAALIELAKYLHENGVKERHNFLFIGFSGEELGLLGSKYFVENPTVSLDDVALMVNMDMIGRLGDEKGLTIGGWGTSPWWGRIIPGVASQQGIKYGVDSSGVGPSDHTSFYMKGVPVLFLFTGAHSDYHKPSDDADKLNYEGEVKVLKLLLGVLSEVQKETGEPNFTTAGNPHAQSTQSSFKVTLGVMPDYSYNGKGLRIDGVTEGRPAHKAGLKAADVLIRMGKYPVNDIQDYMKALNEFEKGQTTDVEVLRGAEKKVMNVTF